MDNVLHLGNAFDYMPTMQPKSIPMIYGDLDFGEGKASTKWAKNFDINKMFEEFYRILKPNGVIVLHSFGLFTADLIKADERNYKYSWVWEKGRTTGYLNAKKQPLRNHEELLVFYKKQPTYNPIMTDDGKYPRSVISIPAITGSKKIYPTQKPVALPIYLIKTYTNEGDIIFDPFTGSGTTGVAAIRTRRKYICIDNSEKAIGISSRRMTEEIRIFEQDQPMFS